MAVNIPNLNVNAIGDGLQDRKNYEAILDILQRYRKELNFYLMNLDLDNMPVVAENIDGLHGRMETVDGQVSEFIQTVDGFQTTVSNYQGEVSQFTQTVNGFQSQVSNYASEVGTFNSTISQLATEVSSIVSFTDVTGNEIASRINQTATTISISASKIDLTGITTIYSTANPNAYTRMSGTGLKISSSTGWDYDIKFDDYINYRFGGSGSATIFDANGMLIVECASRFDDGVNFLGSVQFNSRIYGSIDFTYANSVDFTGVSVYGLDTGGDADAITSYYSNGWCYLDYDAGTGVIEVRNRQGTYIGDLIPS